MPRRQMSDRDDRESHPNCAPKIDHGRPQDKAPHLKFLTHAFDDPFACFTLESVAGINFKPKWNPIGIDQQPQHDLRTIRAHLLGKTKATQLTQIFAHGLETQRGQVVEHDIYGLAEQIAPMPKQAVLDVFFMLA